MSALWQDIRYALRRLRQSPGFVAIAVATLALGIGANAAIFSVVDGVLLRPLPYRSSSRMVAIWSRPLGFTSGYWEVPVPGFSLIRDAKDIFSQVAFTDDGFQTLTGLARPEIADVGYVPSSFFGAAGVPPLFGRVFSAEEEKPGHDHVAVLSYALWKRQFGGNRTILGRTLQLGDRVYTVIGVMPSSFRLSGADLWAPLDPATAFAGNPATHYVRIFAWLRPGVGVGEAQAALNTIAARLATANPREDKGWGLIAVPYLDMEVGNVRLGLLLLFGAVGFVLLIACANLGNLFLARALGRSKELAIRSALGATQGRIARNLLTESVLLALAGGALGLVVGRWGLDLLRAIAPSDTPRLNGVSVNAAVFFFTLGAAIFAGFLSGFVPVLLASRQDANAALKNGAPQGSWGSAMRGLRLSNLLVGIEVALCVVLLAGSLLALRSFEHLLDVDFGFHTDHILSLGVSVPRFKYPHLEQQEGVVERILENLRALPGVSSASAMVNPILEGAGLSGRFSVESESGPLLGASQRVQVRYVGSGYFRTLGIPLLVGRAITVSEVDTSSPVAVVSRSFARLYFPGQDPVGRHLVEGNAHAGHQSLRIVGVVADVRDRDVADAPVPTVYLPLFRTSRPLYTWFLVRSSGQPVVLAKSVEERIWSIDKDLPIRDVLTLDEAISRDLREPHFETLLFSAFAVLGLILALVGIYGVVAYSVSGRTKELGVRVALGARPESIVRLVISGAMTPVLIGIAAGVAGALALTRLMRSLLYEISPSDPVTLAAAIGLILLIALLACIVPACRAARVDPVRALRSE